GQEGRADGAGDEGERDLEGEQARRHERPGAELAAWPDDIGAGDDDRPGAPVVADRDVAPVREERLAFGPEPAAHVLGVLARRIEVDEVGDRKREAQGDVGERVAPRAAAGHHPIDERVPAGAAEREDVLERRVGRAVDDLRPAAPAEPRRATCDRVDPEAAQRWEVTPAGLSSADVSDQEYAYLPSSRSRASVVSRSGWNVSHMTASSCVSVIPIERSASPGCGPCGMPDGCSVTEPTSIPLREEKLPST